jgi:hypothetical protein
LTAEQLQALLQRAFDGEAGDVARVLAELYWALHQDWGWRSSCGTPETEMRGVELLNALHHRRSVLVTPNDGLALLGALDEFLAAQETDPVVIRHNGHEPPLWVAIRPSEWKPPASSSLDQLDRWCRRHNVFPTSHKHLNLQVKMASESIHPRWTERSHWMVAAFGDGVHPQNDSVLPRFSSSGLHNPSVRERSATELATAVGKGPPLRALVLPELSLDPATRDTFIDSLDDAGNAPLLTVPGTYHVTEGTRRHNLALLWGDGVVEVRQRKLQRLTLESVTEEIDCHDTVEVLMGPWGTLVVAICRDFMEIYQDLWTLVGPDVAMVPSMGDQSTMSGHDARSNTLRKSANTTTCMANQPPKGGKWKQMPPIYGLIRMPHQAEWLRPDDSQNVFSLILDDT